MTHENLVLTSQHMSVARAALRFWLDEMPGSDTTVIKAYFDSPDDTPLLHTELASELLGLLSDCRICYAFFEAKAFDLFDEAPLEEQATNRQLLRIQQPIVTVLLRN